MKKTLIILGSLVIALLLAACSGKDQFKKTRSGLLYKIISDGKGEVVKKGNILKIHFTQKVRDSLLGTSYGKMPFYGPVDSVGPTYNPAEVFPLLRKGDSAIVVLLADTLLKKQGQLPPFIKRKDKITLTFRVIDVFTSDSLATADRTAEADKEQKRALAEAEQQKTTKTKELEDYIAKNKITAQKTPGGTFVEVKEPGTGVQADSGKQVSVRYTGKLFPSGKVFESNQEAGKEAFKLVLGTHAVIAGWEEGLAHFKKGGKGTLYIPFYQAYGPQPGPGGTPFENLIFDVVVEDVTNAPAPQAPPHPEHPGHENEGKIEAKPKK